MLDSTSDSLKPSNLITPKLNGEICLEAGFTVSSVVYNAASVDQR